MNTRKDRLNEVYGYLRNHFSIHTKTQFAEVLKITQPALSSAMNGNEAYLTDNLFKRICASYQGVFNLDYLLTGNGTLLNAAHDEPKQGDAASNELLAAKEETIRTLQELIRTKDEYIAILKMHIAELQHERQCGSIALSPIPSSESV